jgi:hypothetical protein
MKKITLLSAALLSAGLVACGGGDPKSASDKPDTLFPEGYVPPVITSSSSSAPSNGAKQAIPFRENFDSATNTRAFFSTAYKALNGDTAKPFYYPAGGFLDEFGNPSPTATSWITADANRKLRIGNGRLTFGQTKLEVNTTTADTSIPTWGEFDLSKAYKVSFCVVQVSAASSSNFEIYVDNNTTGGNNSIYGAGNASRILQVATHTLVPGTRHEVLVPKAAGDKQIGSATSFFQWRVSSGGWAVIDDVVVEYAGEPHGFTLPACVAENSIAPLPEVAPATPAAPTLIAGDAELVVSWASAGADATYEVAYGITNDVTAATAFSGNPVTGTVAQLTGLTNGQEYFVWVKAKNVVGSSDYSPSSSATPVAPTGTDPSKEWGFNSLAYSSFLSGTTGTVSVTVSETAYDADGLKIFLNNGTALRYRADSNAWNFNGHAFASATPVSVVPAVGEVVPALRAYVGVPVVEGRAVTVTFTAKQTGSNQTGIVAVVDQDNRLISVTALPYIAPVAENPNAANVAIPVTLAEGHTKSELRIFYSRENTTSGGMDIVKLLKSYADSPLEPSSSSSSEASSSVPASSSSSVASSSSSVASSSSSESSSSSSSIDGGASSSDASSSSSSVVALPTKTWGFGAAAIVASVSATDNAALFSVAPSTDPTAVKASPIARLVDDLNYYATATSLRYRTAANVWNYNGSSFAGNDRVLPADGQTLDPSTHTPRMYIGVPVTPGAAVSLAVKWKHTTASATYGRIALIDQNGVVLKSDAANTGATGTLTLDLVAGHSVSEVRILFSRENGGVSGTFGGTFAGGLDVEEIVRTNP